MKEKFVFILLDGNEVIQRIYAKNAQGRWKLLRYQSYDLTTFNAKNQSALLQLLKCLPNLR